MRQVRLVPLLRANDSFHARVLVARLGAEGILAQTRGDLDGPYPLGAVDVLVAESELDDARQLLLADDVESSFALDGEPGESSFDSDDEPYESARTHASRRWVLIAAVVLIAVLVLSLADTLL